MNDWIIFGILVSVIIEVMFIFFRLMDADEYWIFDKMIAILIGLMFGLIQLMVLIEFTSGEGIIIWGRLIYELYILIGIAGFFGLNYLVNKLIENIK